MADRSVVVRLRAEINQFRQGMRDAASASDQTASQIEQATRRQREAADDLADSLGKVGLVAAGGLGLSAKAAIDWESAWAGVVKTVGGSEAELSALEGRLRSMAVELGATHGEVAAVAQAAGQLGVARGDIESFTRTMIMLGTASDLSADQAATAIAQMTTVMQTAPDDIDNLGSALVNLGNNVNATESGILAMAQRISSSAALIGISESEVLGIAAAVRSVGIEAEAGGTAISRVFTEMSKAASTGSEELGLMAEVAGMTAAQFAEVVKTDPTQAFLAFTQGLDRINASGGDVFTTLSEIGLADVRVSNALLSMAASGDALSEALALSADGWNENTALTTEFGVRAATTAQQLKTAMVSINEAAIRTGEATLPIIADTASFVSTMALAYSELPAPVHASVASMLALTAAIGAGAWVSRRMINAVRDTRNQLQTLAPRFATATRGVQAYSQSITGLVANYRTMRTVTAAERAGAPGMGFVGPLRQTEQAAQRAAIAAANLRAGLVNVGKTTAGIGALAVAATGAGNALGVQNTAMLGLMGMMLGPWGAAIGAGVGAIMDFGGAANRASGAVDALNVAMETSDYDALVKQLTNVRTKIDEIGWVQTQLGKIPGIGNWDWLNGGRDSLEDAEEAALRANEAYERLAIAAGATNAAISDLDPAQVEHLRRIAPWLDDTTVSAEDMAEAVSQIRPALEEMGYTAADMAEMTDTEITALSRKVNAWIGNTRTAEGRARNLGTTVAGMGSEMRSAADDADALADALAGLMDPGLNLSQARDDWAGALAGLGEEFDGASAAEMRDTLRDTLGILQDLASAEIEWDPTAAATILPYIQQQRDALIGAADAAGMADEEITALVYGWANLSDQRLSDAFLSSLDTFAVAASGARAVVSGITAEFGHVPGVAGEAETQIGALSSALSALPGLTPLGITTPGMPEAQSGAETLGVTLDDLLTPHNAPVGLSGGSAMLSDLGTIDTELGQLVVPRAATINLRDNVTPRLSSVFNSLNSFAGRTYTAAVNVARTITERTVTARADGGWVFGAGGPRDDVIPAMLSNGEFVVNAASARENAALLETINSRRGFADGGWASRTSPYLQQPTVAGAGVTTTVVDSGGVAVAAQVASLERRLGSFERALEKAVERGSAQGSYAGSRDGVQGNASRFATARKTGGH